MIKTAILAATLGAGLYMAFFVDLGGKSLVVHLQEVYATPEVQRKVTDIKDGVKEKLETKLAEAAEKRGKTSAVAKEKLGEAKDEISDADRAELTDVLRKAGGKH
ncbi:MAG: hypothetical protein HY903_15760 [Deltaproteobacteria bacterium]|nr:hypothetical protein [Deltaproteobacteria bacterium]